jgi:hypothetical protein
MGKLDVKEIHGYECERGLKLLRQDGTRVAATVPAAAE